jgi:hypothetical protein
VRIIISLNNYHINFSSLPFKLTRRRQLQENLEIELRAEKAKTLESEKELAAVRKHWKKAADEVKKERDKAVAQSYETQKCQVSAPVTFICCLFCLFTR